jgi:hypothetical protein
VDPRLDLPALWLAAAIVHGGAVLTWFAQDDVTFLARAMGLSPIPWSLSRPLFEGVTFRVLHALFGLNPVLFHLANLVLHLLNTTLVYAIGRRLFPGRAAAFGAGLLFAVSSIAFTPLHWASGIVELQATALALGAIWLYLLARARRSAWLLWAGAATGLAAALTKENAALLPVVLLAVEARCACWTRPGTRQPAPFEPASLLPQTLLSAAFLAAYLANLAHVPFAAGDAYERLFSPAFLLTNLATYLAWCAAVLDPHRDLVAAAHPELLGAGLLVGFLGLLALWAQRKEKRHPEEVGVVAFAAFLLPVLPLAHHSYLYYLYLPWAGACWLLAGAAARLTKLQPRLRWAMLLLAVAVVPVEARNVWARAHARMSVGYARDKTIREAELLRGAVREIGSARFPPGARVGFIVAGAEQHVDLVNTDSPTRATPARTTSYLPLEAALRNGEAFRVFLPGVEFLGFARTVPREWEDARLFRHVGAGSLQPLGTGSPALAMVGAIQVANERWDDARRLFLRTRERGDTLATATLGLIMSESRRGNGVESERYAREFIARWPHDPNAAVVDSALRTHGMLQVRE